MEDFLGNKLSVGDRVVFVQVGYRNLTKGVIQKLSPKTAIIDHEKTNVGSTETKQFHAQLIKINEEVG